MQIYNDTVCMCCSGIAASNRLFGGMASNAAVDHSVVADWRLDDEHFLEAFTLPGPNERCTALELANPLGPREARIQFLESSHTYYIDGSKVAPRSVTGLVHSYAASHFDPQAVVKQMKRGRRWPEKRDQYMKEDADDESLSDDAICELWSKNGRIASARGTLLHYHAECLLNGVTVVPPISPEFEQLVCLDAALREMGYSPFRTEARDRDDDSARLRPPVGAPSETRGRSVSSIAAFASPGKRMPCTDTTTQAI